MANTDVAEAVVTYDSSPKPLNPGNDLKIGVLSTHVWGALGWHDIRQRYRRSVIGPFWFTLSTAIMVAVLGLLYSTLFKQELSEYLPYLAVGLIVWQYLAASMNDGCDAFIVSAHLIKQIRMPLTIHALRIVWRNFIILLHSLPVAIIALVLFGHWPSAEILLLPFGLLLLMLHATWMGIVLGTLCARFRDVQPIVNNFVTVAFFFTPVMWSPEILQDRGWIAEYNPFYHIIEIVRAPIIGRPIEINSWLWTGIFLIVGFMFAQWLLKRYRNRVPYWI